MGVGTLVWSLAWLFPAVAWPVDLLAELSMQGLVVALVVAGVCVASRLRTAIAVSLAALIGFGACFASVRRLPRAPGSTVASLRVLEFNAHAPGRDPLLVLDDIAGVGADVVCMTEPNAELARAIRAGRLGERDPAMQFQEWRHWVRHENPAQVVVSRWPLEREPVEHPDLGGEGIMALRVRAPTGDFGVVMMHPESATTPRRWRMAFEELEAARLAAEQLEARGLPTLIVGDGNTTPTGARSRMLARDGWLRAKPMGLASTFPSWLPEPVGVSIDDVWARRSVSVRSWRVLGSFGSDHRAIEVELEMPRSDPPT
jgi:endonuclease/exonuclease/phosphatase (EEP) superfamily protein YafD